MENKLIYYLNPINFKVDDRNFEDMIIYIKNLSKQYQYFNLKNKPEGNWHEMFASDETFLLADISQFEVKKYDSLRISLTQNFDEFSSEAEKKEIFKTFFELLFFYFKIINRWYIDATKNNISYSSSEIELNLEYTIQNKLKKHFDEFASYLLYLSDADELNLDLKIDFDNFKSIWNLKNISPKSIFEEIDLNQSKLSSALKKLILLYTPVYESLLGLQIKSTKLLNKSIEGEGNHKAQIGLIITFLKLYEYTQRDLNTFSKKHLEFYYQDILAQKRQGVIAKNMFVHIQIDENIESLAVDQGKYLVAGQKEDGSDILYETIEGIILNNTVISELRTLFLSRNNYFDYNSRFKLISGIFSKSHCKNQSEVKDFNETEEVFSTLGEEQLLKIEDDKTMENAEIGFAISTPTLVLGKSDRELLFNFTFTSDSIKYLSNLVIDIANRSGITDEEVFYKIFNELFKIKYTNEENWVDVEEYTVDYPSDWTLNSIGFRVKLSKQYPSVDNYNESIHRMNLKASQPIFQFFINSNQFYYPYSFLSGMEIKKIDIQANVKQLKKLKAITKQGNLDVTSEFEMLGVNPISGSTLMIGSHELFCKQIESLSLGWEYTNLPDEFDSMEEYYKSYNRGINDGQFKLKVSALSDFTFTRSGTQEIEIDMFDLNKEGVIKKERSIDSINVEGLNLKPNYNLREVDLLNFSNDDETGYLKLELISPSFGFGSSIYSKVYNDSVTKAANNPPKRKPIEISTPNDPITPNISNLYVDYKSQSTLYFSQNEGLENDTNQDNKFFLISPFGTEETFSKEGVTKNTLIHNFDFEGELIIGLEKINAPQSLNLLIEIKKSGNENYSFTQNLEWLYSSNSGWKSFDSNDIIYDETINLTKTGVISLSIPGDISNTPKLFNNQKYYIKACSKTKADQFSLIKAIYTNGIRTVEFLGDKELEKTKHLTPENVEAFKPTIPGIIGISQPMKSFGGRDKENSIEFYKRISNTLKHRNRPVTKSDIENFILQRFNWLSFVKCYAKEESEGQFDAKNIQLLCLKKIDENQNIDEIKLSVADKIIIESFLEKSLSPFAKIEIINPQFEDIWIKCKVKFQNISGGKGVLKFNDEFFRFLSPWVNFDSDEINLGKKIKKNEIIQFIKSRPYISFVTGISIIHLKTMKDGSKVLFDSAISGENSEYIEPGTVQSLLVPRNNKIIQLDQEIYSQPETTDYNELGIDNNFIITSGTSKKQVSSLKDKQFSSKSESSKPILFQIKF